MTFTVELPDGAKNVKVEVLCDGKRYCCQNDRYNPGRWNGLFGGAYYGQYFDMEDVDRVKEMMEIASVLTECEIEYILSKFKRQYRIMISQRDYFRMNESTKKRIRNINDHHDLI